MNKFTLLRFWIFYFDDLSNIVKFDPCFTALMIEFAPQCLDLFNIAAVNKDTSESPTHSTICAW